MIQTQVGPNRPVNLFELANQPMLQYPHIWVPCVKVLGFHVDNTFIVNDYQPLMLPRDVAAWTRVQTDFFVVGDREIKGTVERELGLLIFETIYTGIDGIDIEIDFRSKPW